jgi:ABC-type multidrug transport system fused ATPase/permease subunit
MIEPGSKVAFVGASGSGKSTILSLIERLYCPTEGKVAPWLPCFSNNLMQILIDDVDISHLDIATHRQRIAFVTQEPRLFNTSVAENISYGLSPAPSHVCRD